MNFLQSLFHNTILRVIVALNLVVGVVGTALTFYIQSQETVVKRADAEFAEPNQQAEKELAALQEKSLRAQADYTERLNAAKTNIATERVRVAAAEAAVAAKQQQATAVQKAAEAAMAQLTQPLIELKTRLETEINLMSNKIEGLSTTKICLAEVEMEWSGYRFSDLGRNPRLAPPGWRDTRHPDASRLFGSCETGFTEWVNKINAYGAYAVGKGSPAYCAWSADRTTQAEADQAVMDSCKKSGRTCAIMFRIVPPYTLMADANNASTTLQPEPARPGGLLGIMMNARRPQAAEPPSQQLPPPSHFFTPPPFTGLPPPPAPAIPAAQTAALTPAATTAVKPIDNYDFEGGDIGEPVRDVDWSACQDQCPRTSGCVAVSYDKWNRRCYVKGTITVAYLNPRAISKIFNGARWHQANTDEQMRSFPGALEFETGDRLWQMHDTLKTCSARCSEDKECVAVVRSKQTGVCDGIHVANNLNRNGGFESMAKQQVVPR